MSEGEERKKNVMSNLACVRQVAALQDCLRKHRRQEVLLPVPQA